MAVSPHIQYSLVATLDTLLIEANVGSSSAKYVRCCRKILKKISSGELRRPDGMATLLSGSYAYNYVHGCEPDDQQPHKENLLFLCVTEALPYAATPTETREAAHFFLTKIRKSFLETFQDSLELFCNTSSNGNGGDANSSDTQSLDSRSLINIDSALRNQLRMFSSHMKDAMMALAENPSGFQDEMWLDSKETKSEDKKEISKKKNENNNNNSNHNKTTEDLRTKPPLPGHRMYQAASGSKMNQIIDQIEHIKDTVRINIDTALERNERLNLLSEKAQDVQESAGLFRDRSRRVQYQYCRDLYQQRCVLISIVVLVLYIISAMLCGWTWDSCGK